ncbi:hypothetical protein [Rhodococcus sp. NPDC058514]|uniref:hypothetical protein n=1 Tax=unclassified Rhodococcus (in: high G+C Gram-positive bacteria) TaxID=192944 RepID=UPI003648BF68
MNYRELQERWSAFEVDAHIYRVDDSERALDDITALAERAGLTSTDKNSWEEIGPLLELEQESQRFTVYRPSRAVQWVDSQRWQVDDGSAIDVTDKDAIEAGSRVVAQLMLAGDEEFVPTKVTRLNVATSAKGGEPVATRVVDLGVVYSRVLDGIAVEGQGGKIVVYLDANLDPTGFERTNRKLTVHESVSGWRSLDEVLAEVEEYWHRRRDEGLDIDDARQCYVELGRLEEQEYVQPAYALSLTLHDQINGEVRTVDHYAIAATNGIGTLMPIDLGPDPQGRSTY